jgi:hypothetical protein
MSIETRKCGNCFQVKPVTEFYPKRPFNSKPTYQSRCKACNSEVVKGWKMRKKQREMEAFVRGES